GVEMGRKAGVEVTENQATRGLEKDAVKGGDILDIEANVAAMRTSKQGQRNGKGPTGSGMAAVLDDQLTCDRSGPRGVIACQRRGVRFHPAGPRNAELQGSSFIDCSMKET